MKNRILFTALLLIMAVFEVNAQSLEAFKQRLSQPDSVTMARIIVREHGVAQRAIQSLQALQQKNEKIKGYRVRIFFDNSQSARSQAYATLSRFHEFYPEVPAYIDYEAPYFKVTVGNCISEEEAITLWGRVKSNFDRAFVVRETIEISSLIK